MQQMQIGKTRPSKKGRFFYAWNDRKSNLLLEGYKVTGINQLWVTDILVFDFHSHKIYFLPILMPIPEDSSPSKWVPVKALTSRPLVLGKLLLFEVRTKIAWFSTQIMVAKIAHSLCFVSHQNIVKHILGRANTLRQIIPLWRPSSNTSATKCSIMEISSVPKLR